MNHAYRALYRLDDKRRLKDDPFVPNSSHQINPHRHGVDAGVFERVDYNAEISGLEREFGRSLTKLSD